MAPPQDATVSANDTGGRYAGNHKRAGRSGAETVVLDGSCPKMIHVRPAALGDVSLHLLGPVVDAQGNDRHAAVPTLGLMGRQFVKVPHRFLARTAPGRPEFKTDDTAAKLAQMPMFARRDV